MKHNIQKFLDHFDKLQLPGWLCCTWLLLLPTSCKSPGSKRVQTWNTICFFDEPLRIILYLFSPGLVYELQISIMTAMAIQFLVTRTWWYHVSQYVMLVLTTSFRKLWGIPHWCRLPFKVSNSNPFEKSIWVGMIETYWTTRSLPQKHLKVRIQDR